jgi:hypothetical protein
LWITAGSLLLYPTWMWSASPNQGLKRCNNLWFFDRPWRDHETSAHARWSHELGTKTCGDDQGQEQMLINLHSVIIVGSQGVLR